MDSTSRIIDILPVVVRSMAAEVRRAGAKHQLTMPQYAVLRVLAGRDSLVGELARELRVSMPTITQRSDSLIAKGLAKRYSHGRDRRQVWLRITDNGLAAVHECRAVLELLFQRIVEEWPAAHRDIVAEALQELAAATLGMGLEEGKRT